MIKVETYMQGNKRVYTSQIDGQMSSVLMDAALVIRGIYDAIDSNSHDAAEAYRGFVTRCVMLDRFWTADNTCDDTVFVDLSAAKRGGDK